MIYPQTGIRASLLFIVVIYSTACFLLRRELHTDCGSAGACVVSTGRVYMNLPYITEPMEHRESVHVTQTKCPQDETSTDGTWSLRDSKKCPAQG
ncbi:hypothetical protein AOLI_G00179130 [Acnodon oligacanthus]